MLDSQSPMYATVADTWTKERLRRVGARKSKRKSRNRQPILGFRVFKLDSSNVKAWEPDRNDLEQALLDNLDHIKEDRTEQDILYELLLKRGLDLCAPVETRELACKQVYAVGDGELLACLADRIEPQEVEGLSTGIADWISELDGASDVTVVFRDSAFANDVAKTNCTEILKQRGIRNVRSI